MRPVGDNDDDDVLNISLDSLTTMSSTKENSCGEKPQVEYVMRISILLPNIIVLCLLHSPTHSSLLATLTKINYSDGTTHSQYSHTK